MDEAERALADRLRERLDRWNEAGIDYLARTWHEDLVWEEPPGFPDAGVHRGREACLRRMSERLELLGEVQLEVLDVEVRRDRAIVDVIARGAGASSGVPAEMREYFVYDLEDGRLRRWREFLDRKQALAAFAD